MCALVIKPFQVENQKIVKDLILAGLTEHWGVLDKSLNPDLNDIALSYKDAVFLVVWLNDEIVGTGALVLKSEGVGEIVRMSVAEDMRRKGIASKILEQLCTEAKKMGLEKVVLETTSTWTDVIRFYKRFGFYVTHEENGDFGSDTYFEFILK